MRRLLSANLTRLRKDKVFWASLPAVLALSVIHMANGCRQGMGMLEEGYSRALDDYYFELAPFLGLVFAVFMSLFLGTEYSDGTVRNKVVIGHSRGSIYLANLLTCIAASFLLAAAWMLGGLVGLPVFGSWQMGVPGALQYLLISLLFSAALSAIFTLVGSLSGNKAAAAVISILLFLGLLVGASMIYNRLCEPEMISGIVMTTEGMQMSEPSPNPDYVGGALRTAYELILNILPTGQAILMANLEIARPTLQMASSVLVTAAVTAAGISLFRKKDLK